MGWSNEQLPSQAPPPADRGTRRSIPAESLRELRAKTVREVHRRGSRWCVFGYLSPNQLLEVLVRLDAPLEGRSEYNAAFGIHVEGDAVTNVDLPIWRRQAYYLLDRAQHGARARVLSIRDILYIGMNAATSPLGYALMSGGIPAKPALTTVAIATLRRVGRGLISSGVYHEVTVHAKRVRAPYSVINVAAAADRLWAEHMLVSRAWECLRPLPRTGWEPSVLRQFAHVYNDGRQILLLPSPSLPLTEPLYDLLANYQRP